MHQLKWTDHCSLLKSQVVELECHKKTIVKRSITYCHDVNGIIEHIEETRSYSSDYTLRSEVGINKERDFLKVCLNLDEVDNDRDAIKDHLIIINMKTN